MTLDVPSALEYVGPAVELIARHAPASLSPRRIRFNLRTALAEALANAIAYGNLHDTSRVVRVRVEADRLGVRIHVRDDGAGFDPAGVPDPTLPQNLEREVGRGLDRKSTRLNSSHLVISYAVFCLKKKKKTNSRDCD